MPRFTIPAHSPGWYSEKRGRTKRRPRNVPIPEKGGAQGLSHVAQFRHGLIGSTPLAVNDAQVACPK